MEAYVSPKFLFNFCQTMRHHIPEGSTGYSHWCEKLLSHIIAEYEVPSNTDHISKHMKENYMSELGEGKYQLMGLQIWSENDSLVDIPYCLSLKLLYLPLLFIAES
jgi:hypothetical protein